jgi:hypothetical protein
MTDPNAGFQGLQGELGAASQQTAAATSHLRIDPQAAEAAAKHCEDFADQVVDLMQRAERLSNVPGLGDYSISKGITHHFQQKASQPGSGAIALLKQLHDEMTNQAAAFRGAAKDYRAREDDIAQNLGKAAQ